MRTDEVRELTIDEAIELLKKEYAEAEQKVWVFNPVSYALYQVFKIADRKARKRNELQ